MWMVRMRVWVMMMPMVVIMVVIMMMIVSVIMRVHWRPGQTMFLAEFFIPARSVAIAIARAILQATANTLDMVMVAFLRQANLIFKAENLFTVFAHLAIHHRKPVNDLVYPVLECVKHQRVIIEITCFDKFYFWMPCCNFIGVGIDTLDQNASEQEVRKYDDPLVTKLGGMLEPRLHKWKGNAGIAGLTPAKTLSFPQHPHDFTHVGIGIRI